MSKDKTESLKQRAIKAYRQQCQHDANKSKRQFQKAFATEPDDVFTLDDDSVLIKADGLLIRSWLTAERKRWYELVTKCLECGAILSCSSGVGRSSFGDLLELGKVLETLGKDYKTETVCNNCMRAYRE